MLVSLVSLFQFANLRNSDAARQLDVFSGKSNVCLVIDGPSLSLVLANFRKEFIELACNSSSVICCRCSPTQKAEIVELMKNYTQKRVCSIGDGGNDVNMIQTANVGIGIEGREGKQASLAADFSITSFHHLSSLLLVHGRHSYKASARLSQFVIHRGLILSLVQFFFSLSFFSAAIPLFSGWLMVGYGTM